MNDTDSKIAKIVHDRYMQMEGEQRFVIGLQMFETARTIVLSSQSKGATELEKRRHLCERFYGNIVNKVFPEQENL